MDTGAPTPTVVIDGVSKEFVREGGSTVKAIDDATLNVNDKEIVVLLGPSGCGKSTLLRSIAGLETPSSGRISIGGKVVFDSETNLLVPPYDRDVNMMFQSYALWPHMTLEANVAYPLRVRGVSKRSAIVEANEYLDLVGLSGLGRQYAGSVSGGQAQRAALARTLIAKPAVVLFDEPLSNVDAKVRSRLRRELLRLHAELGFSALYVTHDQIEAMGVGTRIAVMQAGRILQVATPEEIYERPEARYVAEFIGEANFFDGHIEDYDGHTARIATKFGVIHSAQSLDVPPVGSDVAVMIRPEYCVMHLLEGRSVAGTDNTIPGIVTSVLYAGSRSEYVCEVDSDHLQVWTLGESHRFSPGDRVGITLRPDFVRLIPRGVG